MSHFLVSLSVCLCVCYILSEERKKNEISLYYVICGFINGRHKDVIDCIISKNKTEQGYFVAMIYGKSQIEKARKRE